MNKLIVPGVLSGLLWLLCVNACNNSDAVDPDSETHWLGECTTRRDCGELECICGICTRACESKDECDGLASAQCLPPQPACSSSSNVCDVSCSETRDCEALGSGFECVEGRCRKGHVEAVSSDGGSDANDGAMDSGPVGSDGGEDGAADAAQPGDSGDTTIADAAAGGMSGDADAMVDGAVVNDGGCADDDGDGVCNELDRCPGGPDGDDQDQDGRPDGCEPALLLDVNTATDGSDPSYFAELGGSVYFSANDGFPFSGSDIWQTDATGSSATQFTQLNPGANDAITSMEHLTRVGDRLYFFEYTGSVNAYQSTRVWMTDGTPTGTAVVTSNGGPEVLAATGAGGLLYFITVSGPESLWRSDGTEAGTIRLLDATSNIARSAHNAWIESNGLLFFTINCELWRSDGTVNGTFVVGEGLWSGNPSELTTFNNRLYFVSCGNPTREIWSTDGSVAGTRLAFTSPPATFNYVVASDTHLFLTATDATTQRQMLWVSGGEGTVPEPLNVLGVTHIVPAGNVVYVSTETEVWRSDGTLAGTQNLYTVPTFGDRISTLIGTATGAYFIAVFPDTQTDSWKLYRADATGVTDVATDLPIDLYDEKTWTVSGDRLFFRAHDDEHGSEPWVTDGTPIGTHEIADINQRTLDSGAASFGGGTSQGEPVVFGAKTWDLGLEPWVTFGNAATTRLVADTLPGSGDGFQSQWLDLGGYDFFVASDGAASRTVYRVDASGQAVMAGNYAFELPAASPAYAGDSKIFFAGPSRILGVPISDITAPGPTFTAADYVTSSSRIATPEIHSFVNWNSNSYFITWSNNLGSLWRTDGTDSGTEVLSDAVDSPLIPLNGSLYYAAKNGTSTEVFRSDGTAAGVQPVTDLASMGTTICSLLNVEFGGSVYFVARGAFYCDRLMRTDGTSVLDVANIRSPSTPFVVGGKLFVLDAEGKAWLSDGTTAGTQAITTNTHLSNNRRAALYRGLVYFVADDGVHGLELWRTDGTVAGTMMEADVNPGLDGSRPHDLYATPDALYFTATTPEYGDEPWMLSH